MGINSYGIKTASSVVETNFTRSLQNGTPKFLASGVARACYALLSTDVGGIAFYDKYFQQIVADKQISNSGSSNPGNYQAAQSGDLMTTNWVTGQGPTTGSQPNSSATNLWLNSTTAAGEFGNAMVDCFSNSTAVSVYSRSNDRQAKAYLNALFVDSDHSDRSIVYLHNGSAISAVPRNYGVYNYTQRNSAAFTINIAGGNLNGSMTGSSSYNAIRKEFVSLGYSAANGVFVLVIYKGVDFDKYPSPAIAFTRPEVVKVEKIFTFPSWTATFAESIYSLKPTLCDNGDIYVTVMIPSTSFTIYKIVRDGSDVPTTTVVSNKAITTSYGFDSGIWYGQRRMQSRDGGAVLCFCPYYYYGAGISTWIIDKRKSVIASSTDWDTASSSYSLMPVPYGDNGFAMYVASNVYAANPSGAYVMGTKERNGNGVGTLGSARGAFHLPYFPLPNTTNYPGLTQVTDYSMLNNQALV